MFKVIKNKKIKVALVGCGRISMSHFKSLLLHKKDFKLISVCDIDEKNLKAAKEKYQVNGYKKLYLMLANENLDLVILCTPSGLHSKQTILAAKKGVSVVTEKPMATNWPDALKMVDECKKNNVKLFVIKQNRKNKTIMLLKRALDDKRFGKIKLVNINVLWTRPQSYYDSADWRGTIKMDGGALMNQASHYVDLLTWLIGPVESLHSFNSRTLKIESEDTGVINLKWKSGAIGSMNFTNLVFPKNLEGSITIIGTKGTAVISGVAVNKITHWAFKDKKNYDKKIFDANYLTNSVYGHGHSAYYKDIISFFRGKSKDGVVTGSEGLRSLNVILSAYKSAKLNKPVKL